MQSVARNSTQFLILFVGSTIPTNQQRILHSEGHIKHMNILWGVISACYDSVPFTLQCGQYGQYVQFPISKNKCHFPAVFTYSNKCKHSFLTSNHQPEQSTITESSQCEHRVRQQWVFLYTTKHRRVQVSSSSESNILGVFLSFDQPRLPALDSFLSFNCIHFPSSSLPGLLPFFYNFLPQPFLHVLVFHLLPFQPFLFCAFTSVNVPVLQYDKGILSLLLQPLIP